MEFFKGVYGHELICERLYKEICENKIHNSYIFEGEEGSGRKTLAKEFCAGILCNNKENSIPCGKCDACHKVFSHNHPDVFYIEKPKDKKTIGVDLVRDKIIDNVYIKPLISDRKIFIIEDGDALTEQSQNSLLKVLEEPPSYASFIIITKNSGMLLKTVLSRSVVFKLRPISNDLVKKVVLLKTNGSYSDEELAFATDFSCGIAGRAINILDNPDFSRLYNETVMHVFSLLKNKSACLSFEKFLTDEKENIDIIINFILTLFRDAILIKLSKEKLVFCKNYLQDIAFKFQNVSEYDLNILCEYVLDYKEKLARNVNFLSATMDMVLKASDCLTKNNI